MGLAGDWELLEGKETRAGFVGDGAALSLAIFAFVSPRVGELDASLSAAAGRVGRVFGGRFVWDGGGLASLVVS